jgi:hypothetical protein
MTYSSVAELSALAGFGTAMRIQRMLQSTEDSGSRTPLWGDEDPDSILERWTSLLESLGVGTSLEAVEKAELDKFGPYYRRPYSEWESKVRGYFIHERIPFSLEPTDDAVLEAEVDKFVSELLVNNGGTKCSPLPISDVYERARKNTNLGFPNVTSSWKDRNIVGQYLRRADSLLKGKPTKLYPFILFRRVQPGGPEPSDGKQRPVWGSDHAETFAGLAVLYPILDLMRQLPSFQHLHGIDPLERALQSVLPSSSWKISADLSSCDATFGPPLVLIGLRIISRVCNVELSFLEQMYLYYTEGRLLTPSGLATGVHGLPSGCAWTNLLETLVLHVLIRKALIQLDGSVRTDYLYGNGDDILILCRDNVEQAKIAKDFEEYGLIWNVSKSMEDSGDATYLQRHFLSEYSHKAIMSTIRMLNRLIYTERESVPTSLITPKQYWMLNTIMKLENCKRHPLFEYFVNFVADGDKYLREGWVELVDINRSQVLGYDPLEGDASSSETGLMNFETIKVLSRRAPNMDNSYEDTKEDRVSAKITLWMQKETE